MGKARAAAYAKRRQENKTKGKQKSPAKRLVGLFYLQADKLLHRNGVKRTLRYTSLAIDATIGINNGDVINH